MHRIALKAVYFQWCVHPRYAALFCGRKKNIHAKSLSLLETWEEILCCDEISEHGSLVLYCKTVTASAGNSIFWIVHFNIFWSDWIFVLWDDFIVLPCRDLRDLGSIGIKATALHVSDRFPDLNLAIVLVCLWICWITYKTESERDSYSCTMRSLAKNNSSKQTDEQGVLCQFTQKPVTLCLVGLGPK